MNRHAVWARVLHERERQDVLKEAGRFPFTCADPGLSSTEKFTVLSEEVGEVARAVLEQRDLANDKHGTELRRELVQVMAVCLAWLEAL